MRERGIIFSAPMVRGLLEGRKTKTRRVIKRLNGDPITDELPADLGRDPAVVAKCPYGVPGDRLWVRETWQPFYQDGAIYLADAGTPRLNARTEAEAKASWPKWRSPIHMPRAKSRITLEITDVRVERLHEISEADAKAEGLEWVSPTWGVSDVAGSWHGHAVGAYAGLWEHINGRGSWDQNPWVWALTFKRI